MKRYLFVLLVLLAAGVHADEAGAAKYFHSIRNSPVELTAFLRAMPKGADLHNHLGGAIYGEHWLDAAEKAGAFYDPATNELTMKKGEKTVTIAEMKRNSAYYHAWLDRVSMRAWFEHPEHGHDHFFDTFSYYAANGEEVSDAQLLAQGVRRAEMQNIRYLELMTLPVNDAWSILFEGLPQGDDFDTLLKHVRSKAAAFTAKAKQEIDKASAEAEKLLGYKYPVGDRRNPVYVRYIGAVNRNGSVRGMTTLLAAYCELMKADKRVVGLQILAPEDDATARRDFRKHMVVFDKVYRAYNKPNIALHCGELTPVISPLEDMTFHIRESIVTGHALRVGHAVSLAWEDDMLGLLKMMRRRGICVETCPTSEWVICGLKGADHPFGTYMKYGVPVSINTDDEGVLRSNLTLEFVRAVQWWKLDYRTLKTLVQNSLRYSFSEGREEELRRLSDAFRRFEERWD
jgi:adenosine deaminase